MMKTIRIIALLSFVFNMICAIISGNVTGFLGWLCATVLIVMSRENQEWR